MAVVTPDLPEIFEEAFERAGLDMKTGYDLKTARRSLNLLTLEWQNRGLNLWTIDAGTQALTAGTATYTMPTDTIDLIEHQNGTLDGATGIEYGFDGAQQLNDTLPAMKEYFLISEFKFGLHYGADAELITEYFEKGHVFERPFPIKDLFSLVIDLFDDAVFVDGQDAAVNRVDDRLHVVVLQS